MDEVIEIDAEIINRNDIVLSTGNSKSETREEFIISAIERILRNINPTDGVKNEKDIQQKGQ